MTELPIERDLRDALAVNPSPQFAARVRARIAEEPARVERRLGLWTWPIAAGAFAAIALAIAVWPPRSDVAPPHASLLAARSFGVDAAALPSAATSIIASVQTPRVTIAPRADRRAEPEILISPSESRAILNLIAGIRTGRIDPSSLPAQPPAVDLDIQPIVIAPLPAVDGGQGVR